MTTSTAPTETFSGTQFQAPPGLRLPLWIQRLLALLVIAGLWQLFLVLGVLPMAAPGVMEIVMGLATVLTTGTFWQALGLTLWGAGAGWGLAVIVGVILGVGIGTNGFLARSTSVLVEFGRAFPVLALMPVVVLVIGVNSQMEIMMIFLSCLWPVLVQAIAGSRRQDKAVADTVEAFRIPRGLKFRKVTIPSALPMISTGLRIAASISILVSVGVGVLSQTPGLGRQITLAQEASRWDLAFAYLLFAGLVGWGINAGIAAIERGALKWNRQEL